MNFYTAHNKLGILGGGQLGKMLIIEANKLNISCRVMDPNKEALLASFFNKSLLHTNHLVSSVYNFGKKVDVLTFEIEHVNVDALEKLEEEGVKVYPSSENIKIIQNKISSKRILFKK